MRLTALVQIIKMHAQFRLKGSIMIDVALEFIVGQLNSYLVRRGGSELGGTEFGRAKLSGIVDDSGKWAIPEDGVGVSLIRLEAERTVPAQTPESTYVGGRHILLEPPLKLNLCVMFAARFKKPSEALRQLSHVLTFFQAHPSFTPDQYPGMDPKLVKISAELLSPSYEQLNQIWAYIGGKYLPSAIYQLRMVILQDTEPSGIQEPIKEVAGTLGNR